MDSGPGLAFGTLLRRARRAASLTQEELAERAGVSARTVSDLERGVSHLPRADTVVLLIEALGLQDRDRATFADGANRLRTLTGQRLAPAGADGDVSPFVGRQRELALLEQHLSGHGPPVLLLAGEPGIGKTRLLHVAARLAIGHGLAVLEGGCQRRGGQEPYAPLLGALSGLLHRQTLAQQRTMLRGCAWLVRLLPELGDGPLEPLPGWTISLEQERRLMFAAVVRLLNNVASQSVSAGTVLLLDDLQWASPDALDLLATVVHSAPEIPLRIIGAYRDTETGPHDLLSRTLADLAHAGLAAHRRLQPLTPAEAATMLGGLLTDEDAALRSQILERAGGVPFFLVSCAQGLRNCDPEGQQDALPWAVEQSIRQRLAALPGGPLRCWRRRPWWAVRCLAHCWSG
jgi:transcriptional regulator with XRE-family HTH domain